MSLIIGTDADGSSPHINGWPDSGGIAVITWRAWGRTFQQEIADEQAVIELLQSIEADDQRVLVSAQLRRLGTGPAG
jgi:hypothetical protein